MFSNGVHATFVPAEVGRDCRLALWPTRVGTDRIDLVVPSGGGVRRKSTRVQLVAIGAALDELIAVGPDAHATRSVRAWAQVARVALELVALGRLSPSISESGTDTWAIAPLTEHDRQVRAALADWLPPEAHCLALPRSRPTRMASPGPAVVAFQHAIADALPRTSAAAVATHQRAWAVGERTDVGALRGHLGSSTTERTIVGLRVALPTDDDAPFRVTLQVRSAIDPSIVADASELWAGATPGFGVDTETDLLLALRRGSRLWPPLTRALDDAHPAEFEISDTEAMPLFSSIANDLTGAGIEVLVPTALTRTLAATAHVEPPPGAGDGPARFDLSTVCELTWRATLDGEPVSDADLAVLADARRPLVQIRGQWVVIDPGVAAKIGRRDILSGAATLQAALSGQAVIDNEVVTVEVVGAAANLAARLRSASEPHELVEPPGLNATLRPYQRRGVAWMAEMSDLGLGGLLADDMGLGKTIQLIALHLHLMDRRRVTLDAGGTPPDASPTLVVCPASVVGNWERELRRFAPSLGIHRYHGTERTLVGLGPDDVVITTYGIARRDREQLEARGWGLVAADEAQQMKNPNSSAARAMRRIGGGTRLALTGTPVENRLTELWALLDWTTPGLLGTVESFRREVALPIERERDADTTERFGRMIAPFVLRRRKDDPEIAPELPPKTETEHPVTLTPEQAGLYRAVADDVLASVERADGIARRGLVLKLLTALKQVCNHPAHYLRQPGPLVGRSGKLDAFDDLVTAITDAGDSTLVFTQYVAMGSLLSARLAELGIASEMLTGSLSIGRRTAMVDRFQAGDFPVFVISLKAGGIGLNLTRATHVIHYDRWWNPAVENQASDRAWRIGQDRPVQVHQLICGGTLEERIAEVLADKTALADAVVGSGEAWLTEMATADLAELVRLGDVDR